MPFAYYDSLSPRSRRTYRKSDRILRVAIPDIAALRPLAAAVGEALASEEAAPLAAACQSLATALVAQLQAPPVEVRVLERRPANSEGELHGLYEPDDVTGGVACVTLWMRTARKVQVVKFRTFLRTLVHELLHHLDYEHYGLEETFHTEGFYARESALFKELLGEFEERAEGNAPPPASRAKRAR
jgi:hypothetical protein